ncbi:MAG: Hin recombinase, partial [Rhizobium sp.]
MEAGKKSFNQLGELLARNGIKLASGDRIKVFDLSCLALSTNMLIRVLAKTLRAGISVEIVSQKLVIEPGATSEMHVLLDTLDGHYRHIHGIKTHP